jgi:GNAT superfamily N-acetyltransferase
VQIRSARVEDVPVILSFIRGLAEYEKAQLGDVTADEAALRESLFGAEPAAEVLLACDGDCPVGFALFFHNFSTWRARPGLYLEDLFVRPEMRGRGFGKALLRELARIAKERRYARMQWAVLDWNRPAIDFYESLGAVGLDAWTIYRLSEPAIDRLADDYADNPAPLR